MSIVEQILGRKPGTLVVPKKGEQHTPRTSRVSGFGGRAHTPTILSSKDGSPSAAVRQALETTMGITELGS